MGKIDVKYGSLKICEEKCRAMVTFVYADWLILRACFASYPDVTGGMSPTWLRWLRQCVEEAKTPEIEEMVAKSPYMGVHADHAKMAADAVNRTYPNHYLAQKFLEVEKKLRERDQIRINNLHRPRPNRRRMGAKI